MADDLSTEDVIPEALEREIAGGTAGQEAEEEERVERGEGNEVGTIEDLLELAEKLVNCKSRFLVQHGVSIYEDLRCARDQDTRYLYALGKYRLGRYHEAMEILNSPASGLSPEKEAKDVALRQVCMRKLGSRSDSKPNLERLKSGLEARDAGPRRRSKSNKELHNQSVREKAAIEKAASDERAEGKGLSRDADTKGAEPTGAFESRNRAGSNSRTLKFSSGDVDLSRILNFVPDLGDLTSVFSTDSSLDSGTSCTSDSYESGSSAEVEAPGHQGPASAEIGHPLRGDKSSYQEAPARKVAPATRARDVGSRLDARSHSRSVNISAMRSSVAPPSLSEDRGLMDLRSSAVLPPRTLKVPPPTLKAAPAPKMPLPPMPRTRPPSLPKTVPPCTREGEEAKPPVPSSNAAPTPLSKASLPLPPSAQKGRSPPSVPKEPSPLLTPRESPPLPQAAPPPTPRESPPLPQAAPSLASTGLPSSFHVASPPAQKESPPPSHPTPSPMAKELQASLHRSMPSTVSREILRAETVSMSFITSPSVPAPSDPPPPQTSTLKHPVSMAFQKAPLSQSPSPMKLPSSSLPPLPSAPPKVQPSVSSTDSAAVDVRGTSSMAGIPPDKPPVVKSLPATPTTAPGKHLPPPTAEHPPGSSVLSATLSRGPSLGTVAPNMQPPPIPKQPPPSRPPSVPVLYVPKLPPPQTGPLGPPSDASADNASSANPPHKSTIHKQHSLASISAKPLPITLKLPALTPSSTPDDSATSLETNAASAEKDPVTSSDSKLGLKSRLKHLSLITGLQKQKSNTRNEAFATELKQVTQSHRPLSMSVRNQGPARRVPTRRTAG
ncbi:proteoglycan 4-like [Schistocerca gregaria]|uniref:proteoglycan 4-like n=1 Tax=Schistocerca gregaria TaxID=7010 RepID=UPI00211F04F4|nr:proteoglycan 4-like [Schistocerca gregaria]